MSKATDEKAEPIRFDSPLKLWPGFFTLPALEEFTGAQWNFYRKVIDDAVDKDNPLNNRQFAYAGLELIAKYGEWRMDIPLATVRGWREKPDDERVLLINWLGKNILGYITDLIDPKG